MQSIAKKSLSAKNVGNRFRQFASSVKKVSAVGTDIISPTIGLNEDQLEFYKVARDFADKEFRPFSAKWDQEETFPSETFKKCADLGFAGIFVKDDVGGSALCRSDHVVIVEALATGCTSTASMLCVHNMCAGMIDAFGNEEQRQLWLPKVCKLETMVSYCMTEPGSGSDASSLITKARFDTETNEYILNGNKVFISGAGLSDLYLVMCRTGDSPGAGAISCIVVPKGTPGLTFGAKEKKMGLQSTPTRQVNFEEVRVPAFNLLGAEGQGFKIAMAGLDGGRLSIGSCSLGAAQACFEIALAYVKERKQFKKSISEYQATQFKLADMAGKILSARHVLRSAALLLDQGHPAAIAHCALAKKIATDNAFEVCNEALQLHGGYGYLKDYDVERYVRAIRVHSIVEGTNEIMRFIVGRQIVS